MALGHLSLSTDRPARWSLLGELRKQAAAGAAGIYDADVWESERVAEGSATVALTMAEELGDRVRIGRGATRDVGPAAGRSARRRRGARGRGRGLRAAGRAAARRGGPASRTSGASCTPAQLPGGEDRDRVRATVLARGRRPPESEGVFGSTWPQSEGILSSLSPPERLAGYLAAPTAARETVLDEVAAAVGEEALDPAAYVRARGRWTRSPAATSRPGRPGTSWPSARATARTRRHCGSAAPTSGSPATWRAP